MQFKKKRVKQDICLMRKEHLSKTGFDSKTHSSTIIEMQKHHSRSSQTYAGCCTQVWKCQCCVQAVFFREQGEVSIKVWVEQCSGEQF